MSRMEYISGKIKAIDTNGLTNEEYAKKYTIDNDLPVDLEMCDDYLTYIQYELAEKKFMVIKDTLYKVIKYVDHQDGINIVAKEGDTIKFIVSFYNGGGDLTEALGYEIDKL